MVINSTFSNVSRYTRENRFKSLEKLFLNIISCNEITSILDVGVSTGETSVDLYRILPDNIKLHISDPYSILYKRKLLVFNIYFDFLRELKGIDFLGFPIKRKYSNRFLTRLAEHFYTLFKPIQLGSSFVKVLSLHKEAVKLIDEERIIWEDFDLFNLGKVEVKFDMIRVMNVLNHELFSPKEFRKAFKNILEILNPNGIIFLGRSVVNSPDKFSVSVFKRVDNRLIEIHNLNGGSDFRKYIPL